LNSDGVTIVGCNEVGEVTARILMLNHPDRLLEREALRDIERYPPPGALARMQRP
jgi:hypothetical protein